MIPLRLRPVSYTAAFLALAAVVGAACVGTGGNDEAAGNGSPPFDDGRTAGDLLASRFGGAWPDTDFSRFAIDADEIISGGPGKDVIPAIDDPSFVSVDEAAQYVADEEPIIALEVGDDARAYPVQILIWHEIVNDVVGGIPLAITFCPLCNSAIAFERERAGVVYDFGVSGLLRNSDLVMYDRQTESWWQQLTGEAIVGELTGTTLEFVPASTISFADFRAAFPDGLVLSRDTGFIRDYGRNPYAGYDSSDDPFLFRGDTDARLPAAERVVAVELGGEAVAYPFSALQDRFVVEDTVGATDIVVFFQPGTRSALDDASIAGSRDVGATGVFRSVLDGRTLTFRADDGRIVDNETGSRWSIVGTATDGPLAGSALVPVVHGDHFWFAWAAFKPDTRIWAP